MEKKRKTFLTRKALTVGFVFIVLSLVGYNIIFNERNTLVGSPAVQVSEVVSTQTGFADTPASTTLKEGELPTRVLPAAEYLSTLNEFQGTISDAQLNSTTGVTGAMFVSDEETEIIAARFLEEQYTQLATAYAEKDITLTIVSPTTRIIDDQEGNPVTLTIPTPLERSTGMPLGWSFALTFLFIIIVFILFRSILGKKAFGLGGNQKDAVAPPDTRFSDVAGCDEAVEELSEIVLFLKEPERFQQAGARMSRGALLAGPAGTGKTLLARAVAGEAGVPFYAVSGSDFTEMFVGVGAKRVRELFAKAKKHQEGAIIFIDEIDAVGRKRSTGTFNSNQEQEGTLNSLLVEMDGFEKTKVIVIGATNRPDMLDEALTRPGRLDRKVSVGLPDRLGRERILEVHTKTKNLDTDVDLGLLARRTSGMSGADIEQVVNEACMEAARADKTIVNSKDFSVALATVAMGKARTSAVVTEHDRNITAWHEAGHTVVAMVLPDAENPVSVSIIPRGVAGGVTWMAEGDDLFLTRKRAFARLVVAMGGRAGEEILLDGEFTSGPHGDLTHATNLALAMVTQYGMSEVGLMIRSEGLLSTGSQVTDDTVAAVEDLLAEALTTARETLAEHRELFNRIVEALLEDETIDIEKLIELQEGTVMATTPVPPTPYEYRKHQRELKKISHQDLFSELEKNKSSGIPSTPKAGKRKNRLTGALAAAFTEWRNTASPRRHVP